VLRGLGGGGGGELELFAGGLLGDQVEDLDPVLVLVLGRVELGGQGPSQHFPQKFPSAGS
jgi:hypothetical protein